MITEQIVMQQENQTRHVTRQYINNKKKSDFPLHTRCHFKKKTMNATQEL